MEVSGRRGRKRKQILDDLKEKCVYWKLKEETTDRSLWGTRFGSGFGLVARQATEIMNDVLMKQAYMRCVHRRKLEGRDHCGDLSVNGREH